MAIYTADGTFRDGWWHLTCPEVAGVEFKVRKLDEIHEALRRALEEAGVDPKDITATHFGDLKLERMAHPEVDEWPTTTARAQAAATDMQLYINAALFEPPFLVLDVPPDFPEAEAGRLRRGVAEACELPEQGIRIVRAGDPPEDL